MSSNSIYDLYTFLQEEDDTTITINRDIFLNLVKELYILSLTDLTSICCMAKEIEKQFPDLQTDSFPKLSHTLKKKSNNAYSVIMKLLHSVH